VSRYIVPVVIPGAGHYPHARDATKV